MNDRIDRMLYAILCVCFVLLTTVTILLILNVR